MFEDRPRISKRIMRLEFPDHPAQESLDDIGLQNRISQRVSELTLNRITFGEAIKQMHVTQEEYTTREVVLLAGGGLVELIIDGFPEVHGLKVFDCEVSSDGDEVVIVSNRQNPYREFLLDQLAQDRPSNRAPDDTDREEG